MYSKTLLANTQGHTMKTEKQLHQYMRKECKQRGIGFYKLNCEGQTGFPDLMLVYDGWTILVELKSPSKTGRLSERQIYMIQKLRNLGAEVDVIDSKEGADTLITELIGR